MDKNVPDKENDPRIVYADIIDLPHWQSPTRPHMSLNDRSAQFASYKSLRGYEDMVSEEARQTEEELQLEERELQRLNQKLALLSDVLEDGEHPRLTFTVFLPDERKDGGKYVKVTGTVRRIDQAARQIVLTETAGFSKRHKFLDFDRISAIQGELVDYIDEDVSLQASPLHHTLSVGSQASD